MVIENMLLRSKEFFWESEANDLWLFILVDLVEVDKVDFWDRRILLEDELISRYIPVDNRPVQRLLKNDLPSLFPQLEQK